MNIKLTLFKVFIVKMRNLTNIKKKISIIVSSILINMHFSNIHFFIIKKNTINK